MNHLARQFVDQYDREHPDFAFRVCAVVDLYDTDLDIFHIEEVNDEYVEFKEAQKHDFS